jgi:hypothetical protein
MSHQLYRDWLFEEEELLPEQSEELNLHLQQCDECRRLAHGWGQVLSQLSQAPIMDPMPGFGLRWRERLVAERMKAHQRHTSILLVLFTFGAAVLFLPLASEVGLALLTPETILFDIVERAVDWFTWLSLVRRVTATFIETLIQVIPTVWWVIISVLVIVVGTAGIFSANRFARLRKQSEGVQK